ncbi:MAG TPA: acyl-CoA thioester hydrolase/BAAT C-terminal domain-containing protein [Solirubrobacteraceae bacterium]|nr:acyl-CoA thioester hydrolase/BAAT C-terminal domain-containing protein [Solirubrobacteraceae bacterium]
MAGARKACSVAAVAAALVAGCGGDDAPAPTASKPTAMATATATPTPAPTEAPPNAPAAKDVKLRATDGEPVRGRYTAAGRDAPAVLLLHQSDGGVNQMDPLVPYLHAAGYATLAYQSRPSPMEAERLPDALGALRWLRDRPDVDPERLALVGASIGASTTVLAMATKARTTVDAAVALSPADSSDIWALQDDDRYRPHDVLFITDDSEAASAEGMLEGAVRSELVRSQGPGHGIALVSEQGVRDALLGWLDHRVR